eukprot:1200965-Pleurochrysis_carterae.AAC.2
MDCVTKGRRMRRCRRSRQESAVNTHEHAIQQMRSTRTVARVRWSARRGASVIGVCVLAQPC